MFNVYCKSARNSFKECDSLDSALNYAFRLIAKSKRNSRVWIETDSGEVLPLMN